MRAIVVRQGGGPEVLRLEEMPDPVPGEGQTLVRIAAAAVNHVDISLRRSPNGVPFIPGLDAAGTRVDDGTRVLVSGQAGTYAELIAAPDELVRPIPDTLDAAEAAALGVTYRTAWALLAAAGLERGDRLLVQAGSSGTGQACIDLGRALGATVFATAGANKLERLREIGAEPFAYDDPRLETLGVDVVFDPVGAATFERSLAALGAGGRIVTPGALGDPNVSLNIWTMVSKGASVIAAGATGTTPEELDHMIELAGRGELRPVIDRELPLESAAEAHRLIEERRTFGKIVLRL